jgi:hypothetical protein
VAVACAATAGCGATPGELACAGEAFIQVDEATAMRLKSPMIF